MGSHRSGQRGMNKGRGLRAINFELSLRRSLLGLSYKTIKLYYNTIVMAFVTKRNLWQKSLNGGH